MERERWEKVYRVMACLDKHDFRGVFQAAAVLAVYFGAVIHDRPVNWACKRENWDHVPFRLPSQPTMSRRLRQPDVTALLQSVERHPEVAGQPADTCVKIIDGKSLVVGGCSKDPEAKYGRAASGFAKGYKLFAIWGRGSLPLTWRVDSLNISEESTAAKILPELRGSGGYVLGDSIYDVNRLYDIAADNGHQLVAPKKRPGTGLGHRRHSPARLRCLEILDSPFGRELYAGRTSIERNFGNIVNFGGGLAPLPSWVRRLTRVKLWVHAKLIIHALRRFKSATTAVE